MTPGTITAYDAHGSVLADARSPPWRTGTRSGRVARLGSSLLVLQHIACEPPAAFEDELRSRGLDVTRVELDEGEPLPDRREFRRSW